MDNDTILDLLLFLKEQEYEVSEGSILVWINFEDIRDFTDIFGYEDFCEDIKEVKLLYNCIVVDLYDFLWGFDELEYIRKKLEEWEN